MMETDSSTTLRSDYNRSNYTLKCSRCLKPKDITELKVVDQAYICNSCLQEEYRE